MDNTPPTEHRSSGSPAGPPRLARWVLAITLLLVYLLLQLALVFPVVLFLVSTGRVQSQQELLDSDVFVWVGLGAATVAALATVVLVWIWPRLWHFQRTAPHFELADWVGWHDPKRIGLGTVAVITAPLVVILTFGVEWLAGPVEVDVQMELFRSPALQIVSSLVVSTVVPVAEELIFRGALYSALLPRADSVMPGWRRNLWPFIVTSAAFAAAHLLAGFEMVGAIIAVLLLSMYLSGLRALTGSVKASIVGHLVWNVLAALGIVLANLVGM